MPTAAESLAPLIDALCGGWAPLHIRCWDGSELRPRDDRGEKLATILIATPNALRRILWEPNELGFSRAYVAGELDVEGDIWSLFRVQELISGRGRAGGSAAKADAARRFLAAARAVGALGRPLPPPPEEAHVGGRLHSRARDASAIAHHYDVSNDFYRLVLGESMTYSCAYFETPDASLAGAQQAKYDLVCRKLGLRAGMRLLDIGCGWGGMVRHAAEHYGVEAVGVTLSQEQVAYARDAVDATGLGDRVKIRYQDYRDVADGPYDAISSIGMVEHVGAARLPEYFACLYRLLRPGGRLLNHGITWPSGSHSLGRNSFMGHYVFPDGELHDVGLMISAMQAQGFEARDAESLREHYALTLRHWVANLEASWNEAVRLSSEGRARVWRLYMAGSAVNFERGKISVHQVLAVRPQADGTSAMPATRAALLS